MPCQNCKNALFNELWGEYKCKLKQIVINILEDLCPDFVEGTPEVSKEDRYPEED